MKKDLLLILFVLILLMATSAFAGSDVDVDVGYATAIAHHEGPPAIPCTKGSVCAAMISAHPGSDVIHSPAATISPPNLATQNFMLIKPNDEGALLNKDAYVMRPRAEGTPTLALINDEQNHNRVAHAPMIGSVAGSPSYGHFADNRARDSQGATSVAI